MQFEVRTSSVVLTLAAAEMSARHDEIRALRDASPESFQIDQIAPDGTRRSIVAPVAVAAAPVAPPPEVIPVAVLLACDACGTSLDPVADVDQILCAKCRPAPKSPEPTPAVVVADTAMVVSTWESQIIDDAAKVRIDAQHAALRAIGLSGIGHKGTGGDGEQFFANGTRMAAEGYARQAERKAEHDRMLTVVDAAHGLVSAVRAEGRLDVTMSARDFGASIVVAGGKILVNGHSLSERAIRGLLARIESPALGYVLGVRERIAAEVQKGDAKDKGRIAADVAHIAETLAFECKTAGDVALKLRTRKAPSDVFAVVSPTYSPADAPESMDELLSHLPHDARGTWTYDPRSTAWEFRMHAWTPTAVEAQAVGEAVEGSAVFKGRDNGTGRWSGGGGVTFVRCLNASVYTVDSARVSRVHRGNVLGDVAIVVKGATQAISALCQLWGRNREIEVSAPAAEGPIPMEQAIPGFWRWLLQDRSSELAGVLRGKTEEHVKGLASSYHAERRDHDRVTRADLGQGWTKYSQRFDVETRGVAESAIGSWLANVRPVGFTAPARG